MQPAALPTLEAAVADIRRSPGGTGTVELIVRRPAADLREVLSEGELDPAEGLIGDRWRSGGSAKVGRQLTLMNARVAAVVAGTRDRWPLAGDQLYVDLDLSTAALPPGSRLVVGSAVIEISAEPHTGCGKFARRFGVDALRFVNSHHGRELNLRGVNARVISAGTVRPGDAIRRIEGH